MENASKALIIAGAILLSILIIAIGMYIYDSSQNSINEAGAQIGAQEKNTFNQQWNTYEGQQSGANVKALIQKMIGNAKSNEKEDSRLLDLYCEATSAQKGKGVTVTSTIGKLNISSTKASDITFQSVREQIESRHIYTVSVDFDATTGLINKINVKY